MPEPRLIPTPKRLVLKIGSAVLAPGGKLSSDRIDALSDQIARVRRGGVDVTVVSSGAVACGFRALGLDTPPADIVRKQAAAAIGQPQLMQAWHSALSRQSLASAQVLLISDDFVNRTRYLNARRVLGALSSAGVVPIINENDTVSYDEIRFGDNDALAAHVAGLISADLMIVLSTASGLYQDGDPTRVIPSVRLSGAESASALQSHVSREKTLTGVGGMASKLHAMGVASSLGVASIIASGAEPNVLLRLLDGENLGTMFDVGGPGAASRRDAWIVAGVRVTGSVTVDPGAATAIVQRGASLLPRGVVSVRGTFDRGSSIDILDDTGRVIARGLASYTHEEARAIQGQRSSEIEARLGYTLGEELVHRDDLVVMSQPA
ncbi:MAG: glutamate 5-kinase [Phycisphaerales bacterium]|nr:glutamate 5-kinase [Phycisphaerales bacterium]